MSHNHSVEGILYPAPSGLISQEEAAHVLFHFRGEGYQPGSFVEALLLAFSRADVGNRLALRRGFPSYYEAMNLAQNDPDGIDKLRAIFKGEEW